MNNKELAIDIDCDHKDSNGRLVFSKVDIGLNLKEKIAVCDICGDDISDEEQIQAESDAQGE